MYHSYENVGGLEVAFIVLIHKGKRERMKMQIIKGLVY